MKASTVFPTWRPVWKDSEGIQPLLAKADAVMRRRARGNRLLPKWDTESTVKLRAGIELEELRRWTDGEPPENISKRPLAATRIYGGLAPALRAAAWQRWLFLERAFLDGSNTGDLLFSALAIRTMCEEVQKLRSLDLNAAEIEDLATAPDGATEHARLMLFFRTARANLDAPEDPRNFDPKSLSDLDCAVFSSSRLQEAKKALNDYVHPNYGSHVAALYPEHAAAARILLEGVIAAYEEFFTLSWAEEPLAGPGRPLDVTPVQSWPQTVRRFTKEVLNVYEARATVAWLTANHSDAEKVLSDPEIGELVNSLRLLTDAAHSKTTPKQSGRYRLWEGASDTDVLFLVRGRRAEQILTETFPEGAPSSSEQQRWLHFVALALQLAMLLHAVKVASLKAQLVRQIVSGNPLGTMLCERSLLEHKAVVEWLVSRLGSQWAEIGKRVNPAKNLPTLSAELERDLAKFLAGTKGSAENKLPWTKQEVSGRWTIHLSLPGILKGAFKSADRFRQIYYMASAALHGRILRGLDLLAQTARNDRSRAPGGILVLEYLCDPDERMGLNAEAAKLMMNIEHAASRGGTVSASSDSEVKGAFGHFKGKLKPGRDYTGDGSRDKPFRIRPHLQFHRASHALLEQLGIEFTVIHLDRDADGRLCDRYQAAEKDWWFILPEFSPV